MMATRSGLQTAGECHGSSGTRARGSMGVCVTSETSLKLFEYPQGPGPNSASYSVLCLGGDS